MLGGADNANGELPSYITGANRLSAASENCQIKSELIHLRGAVIYSDLIVPINSVTSHIVSSSLITVPNPILFIIILHFSKHHRRTLLF